MAVFNAKSAKVLTQRGRKDFADFVSIFFAIFASKNKANEGWLWFSTQRTRRF